MTVTEEAGSETSPAYFIWEDAEEDTWWLSRRHDESAAFVIAPDSVTNHVLVLRQPSGSNRFKVIAAVQMGQESSVGTAVAEAKRTAVKWI
ncbi:MAG: hypothetical protein ACPHGY_05025, partial [Rhodospirillaceae bacterium]